MIDGRVIPGFERLADRFSHNFAALNEVGASLCVTVGDVVVADLWGGHRDAARTVSWERDTISVVFSNTKAATALCVQKLIANGELDLDAPVMRYWPEFSASGKETVTLRMLLNHTAGLPALRDAVAAGGYYDWDYMTARLAAEEPWWEPGRKGGYHMTSFGWLLGEVIRRVTGRSLGGYFAGEIAGPLGLAFWIGLPEAMDTRVAPMIPYRLAPGEVPNSFVQRAFGDADSLQAKAFLNNGGYAYNRTQAHRAQIGGAGGIGNARGICGMFTPLANGGGGLLPPERIADMRMPSSEPEMDETLLIPTRFGQGFMLRMDNRGDGPGGKDGRSLLIGDGAFGHVGIGGSVGFADPERRLAFAYTMNRMGGGFLVNERAQGLIDVVYDLIG